MMPHRHANFKIIFLGCVIGGHGIEVQLPSDIIAQNFFLNPVYSRSFQMWALIEKDA
jgi:hypothetical protein